MEASDTPCQNDTDDWGSPCLSAKPLAELHGKARTFHSPAALPAAQLSAGSFHTDILWIRKPEANPIIWLIRIPCTGDGRQLLPVQEARFLPTLYRLAFCTNWLRLVTLESLSSSPPVVDSQRGLTDRTHRAPETESTSRVFLGSYTTWGLVARQRTKLGFYTYAKLLSA